MPGADHDTFWRESLAGHPVTRLPRWTAAPRPGQVRASIAVPGSATTALGEPAELLTLAAFVRVTGMLTGETDIVIGYRARPGRPAVPLRVRLAGGSWRDLIAAVRAAGQAVAPHLDCPPRAAEPLFDAGFGPGFGIGPGQDPGDGQAGVAVAAECAAGRIWVRCAADLFDGAYAARFAGYLNAALAAMTAGPAESWQRAGLLSAAERRHLLDERGGPPVTLPPHCAHTLFEQQARARPDAVAVCWRDERWSYDRVNQAANQIAHALLTAGLRAEDVVAVATGRHPLWLCAVLGVLKAGGAYLPVEPEFPAARVATLVEQSGCRFLLTDPDAPAAAPDAGRLWTAPVPSLLGAGHPSHDPGIEVRPHQLAYIYFTSGSTGVPKGAMCEHIGMLNHLAAKTGDFAIGPDDVVVQNARQSFDISLWQLIAPLMVGGRTLILPGEAILDVRRFAGELVAGGATILQVVPSYLDILLRHLEQGGRAARGLGVLRSVCVTGEAISKPLADRWFASCPQVTLVNAYGATEASDDTTHEVMSAPPPGELVPVGRPVGNVTVYVLGPGDTLRPLGSAGEIAFSGICVGRGYVNDPRRTAEVFAPDPFRPGQRMYRTGDFGRWLPSGSLAFHGRRDEQVKIHGVRVELGEVESRACAHPLVHGAAVVAAELAGGGKELVTFYTSPAGLEPAGLRQHLAGGLPAAAVPARVHRLDALPLTANGKVDKRRLASMAAGGGGPAGNGQRVPPRTGTQRRIAAAWAQAMKRPVDDIGCDDNFFDIGGSSLSALRVVVSLNGLISLDDLVRNPVLSALSAVADGAGRDRA
jgi:amino acid adenylation domain-containing protein